MLIGIIADDLSGAGGIAGDFARFGMTACVLDVEDAERANDLDGVDVLVTHTNSRAQDTVASALTNRRAALSLAGRRPFLVINKIDSLLRGPIASDVGAVMNALGQQKVLVIAAVPSQGRITVDGIQCANGSPLLIRDADGAQQKLRLADLFGQTGHQVHHIGATLVEGGSNAIERAVNAAGDGIFICDATTEEHIKALVRGALAAGIRLFASSYGIAYSILSACAQRLAGPILGVAGSVSENAQQQLSYAIASKDIDAVLWSPSSARTAQSDDRYCSYICDLLRADRSVLVHTADGTKHASREPDESIGPIMRDFLRALVRDLPKTVSGFVATGGATAEALRSALGAQRVTMLGPEALPCVPFAVLEGGPFSGVPFVTKPGTFGDVQSLVKMIELTRIAGLSARRNTRI